jgi:hypothetical protein
MKDTFTKTYLLFQMPYKRVSKHLDDSKMDANERAWHATVRPTWGPSGTLVFAATAEESAFKRSQRITEKNGLMTVMKGGVVSESQDIRIAKFTNEVFVPNVFALVLNANIPGSCPREPSIFIPSLLMFSLLMVFRQLN